jgi:hypothetical protein
MKNYINAFGGEGTILARAFVLANAFGLVDDGAGNACEVNTFDFATDSHDYLEVEKVITAYDNVAKLNLGFTCNVPIKKGRYDLKRDVVLQCFTESQLQHMSINEIYVSGATNSISAKENMHGSFSDEEVDLQLEEGLYGNLRIGNTIYKRLATQNAFAKSGMYDGYVNDITNGGGLSIFSLGGFKGGGTGATLIPIEIGCYNRFLVDDNHISRDKYRSYRVTSLPYSKYEDPDDGSVEESLNSKYYFAKSGNLLQSLKEFDSKLKRANQTAGYSLDAAILVSGFGALDVTAKYNADNQNSDLHGVNFVAALSMVQIMNGQLDDSTLNGNPLLFNLKLDTPTVSYKNLAGTKEESMRSKVISVCRFAAAVRFILLPTFALRKEDFVSDFILCNIFSSEKKNKLNPFSDERVITEKHLKDIAEITTEMVSILKSVDEFYEMVITALRQMNQGSWNFRVELVNPDFITAYTKAKLPDKEINASQLNDIRVGKLNALKSPSKLSDHEAYQNNEFNGAHLIEKFRDRKSTFHDICEGGVDADTAVRKLLTEVYSLIRV